MHYLESNIAGEIWVAARTTLPAFRWRYHIIGNELGLYNNIDLIWCPKLSKILEYALAIWTMVCDCILSFHRHGA